MFFADKRRIAELEALAAFLRRELDKARSGPAAAPVKDWEGITKQLAKDRVQAQRNDAREMARLNDVAEGWETLASQHQRRSQRLTRAVMRCWEEIGRLRRQLAALDVSVLTRQLRDAKEREAALSAQLAILQDANEAHYRDMQARPARIPRQQFKAAS